MNDVVDGDVVIFIPNSKPVPKTKQSIDQTRETARDHRRETLSERVRRLEVGAEEIFYGIKVGPMR